MKDTLDGSQVDPQKFLTSYAEGVDSAICELQRQRRPGIGEKAMSGAEDMSVAAKAAPGGGFIV